MTLAERLRELIDACFTGLWVQSHEHDDAFAEIARLCRDQILATGDLGRRAGDCRSPARRSRNDRRRHRSVGGAARRCRRSRPPTARRSWC